jgi:uncharacterized membrane protein
MITQVVMSIGFGLSPLVVLVGIVELSLKDGVKGIRRVKGVIEWNSKIGIGYWCIQMIYKSLTDY